MISKFVRSLRGKPAVDGQRPAFGEAAFSHHQPSAYVSGGAGSADEIVRQFQHERNSHVIGLIHRHQNDRESWESWFFDAMIGEHHLQDFMTALQSVPLSA